MAGDVSFAITLQDDVSPAAQSAAASLQQTASALQQAGAAAGALAGGQTRAAASMRTSGAAAEGAARNVTRLTAAESRSAGDALASEERNAARAMAEAGRAAEGASGKIAKLAKAQDQAKASAAKSGAGLGQLGGLVKGIMPQFGGLIEQSGNLAQGLGGISPKAALAAVAAAVFAAAVAAAAYKLVSFGIGVADAAQHLRAMSVGMMGSVAEGDKLNAMIGSIARTNVVAADKVQGFAKELVDAKITGAEMRSALDAAAKSSRLMGDQAGAAFIKAAVDAKKAGKSITELSDEARKKLGPGLAIEMQRPSVALERLQATAASLFANVDTSGFGAGLNAITDSLEEGAAVGDAWRAIFGSVFATLGDMARSAGAVIVAMMEEMTIVALKTALFFRPLTRAIGDLWDAITGGADSASTFDMTSAAAKGLGAAVVVAGGMAVAALMPVAAAVLAATWPILAVGAAVTALAVIWEVFGDDITAALSSAWDAVVGFFGSIGDGVAQAWSAITGFVSDVAGAMGEFVSNALDVGINWVKGLGNGIANGAKWVWDKAKEVAQGAVDAVKNVFRTGSPSKVMAQIGTWASEGVAVGIDAGAPSVADSSTAMAQGSVDAVRATAPNAAIPTAALPGMSARGQGNVSSGARVDVGGVTITISGVAGAENILERLPAAIADAFEQVAESLGIAPAEA